MLIRIGLMACVLALAGTVHALSVRGIAPMEVVAVDASDQATLRLSGEASGNRVEVAVIEARKTAYTHSWTELARVKEGGYDGLVSIPLGGPYRIVLRDMTGDQELGRAEVDGVLAGDLWVLAGQSNMQGIGNIDAGVEPSHAQVHVKRMNHEWTIGSEPLHILQESPDPVHGTFDSDRARADAVAAAYKAAKGAGLGLAFGRAMVEATGRPVGLIATAHGGTSLEQWNPAAKAQGGNSLYGSMLAQVASSGPGKPPIRGVLWYQGESDASPDWAPSYGQRQQTLVQNMREDFGGKNMPFYYVQIGRFANPGVDGVSWSKLRAEQLRVEQDTNPGGLVTAIDLELDDLIHVGTPGLITLGERLANLALRDLHGGKVQAGPRFKSMEVFQTPYGSGIRVRFAHVNGSLRSAGGRMNGFAVGAGDGTVADHIYKQEVDPQDPTAVLLWLQSLPEKPQLYYGYGANPYCNVTDDANMALPAFGPVPVTDDVVRAYAK